MVNKMTQEDKDLILKDLCARLPYGIVCHYQTVVPMVGKVKSYDKLRNISFLMDRPCFQFGSNRDIFDFDNIKPYLFPLSSMTEEQREEYESLCIKVTSECADLSGFFFTKDYYYDTVESIDYLYKNHIDIRDLIPMGLALDATGKNIY